jgi:dihydropyrimidine dehydrogenase (NAD+) subunit PreT
MGAALADAVGRLEPPPPLGASEAITEANRCLMCWDAPCTRACPTSIDVPRFIKQIATGDDVGSARTILTANILGSSCGRVCPTEVLCEGACVLNDLHHRPIEIGRLQAFATDPFVLGGQQMFTPAAATGRSVAVVGSGPAGLSCAAELAKEGHQVIVYESDDLPGGLNSSGVANYKLDQATALAEVDWIKGLGVTVETGVTIGTDISVEALVTDHDAVFLGVGLGAISPLGLPGEEVSGSGDALEFIADLKSGQGNDSLAGEKVAVIGGGNTAIDAVVQAARLGADKVYLVYRRGREHVRAYDHEVDLALAEGVEVLYWSNPVEILGTDRVIGLRCRPTELVEQSDGRVSVELSDGAEFTLDVTRVLRATGQEKPRRMLSGIDSVEIDDSGRVVADEEFRTTDPRIWAGGDCVNGGQEVVNAVAHGAAAARSIHRDLTRR